MQSVQILKDKGVHAWLTFVRETSQMQDPCMDLIVGVEVAWHSAFMITSKGARIAIVGRFARENIERTGAYQQVMAYDESIRQPLVDTLNRLKPQCIAINYSENDPAADGRAVVELARGVRRHVVLERVVVEVLAPVGEHDALHARLRAGVGEQRGLEGLRERAAERHGHRLFPCGQLLQ